MVCLQRLPQDDKCVERQHGGHHAKDVAAHERYDFSRLLHEREHGLYEQQHEARRHR